MQCGERKLVCCAGKGPLLCGQQVSGVEKGEGGVLDGSEKDMLCA